MRHLSAWAAAFLFFAGFFLAFFDFWGDTPGPEFCGNSRERGPRSPRNRARGFDPPWGTGRGVGAAGPRRGRRAFFARGRGGGGPSGNAPGAGRGGGFPPGEGGRGRTAARRKTGRRLRGHRGPAAGAGAPGGRLPGGGAGGAARGHTGSNPAGRAQGGKSAGRAGRGAGFFGAAPIFGGGGRKNPRFCFIRKRGFSPAFLCRIRADFFRKPCAFHRVAFSAGRSDEYVAAGKKAKTKSRRRGREKNRRAKREGTP